MSDHEDFEVAVGTLLSSVSSDYEVQEVLGSGTFGEVTQCRKIATNETVAIKIIKSMSGIEEAKEEEETLKRMKKLGSERFNIVRWNDSFMFEGRFCLEFEKLDISLFDLMQEENSTSLELMAIRPILQQLATALAFLKSSGIVHADMKPENIMLVDRFRQPLIVKVIDFGLACSNPEEWKGATLQTLWYRAPEVLLGAPFDEAIDVWSLGCIAVELLKGNALFPGSDEYDMMRHIVRSIGKPPEHLLNSGMYTQQFFRTKKGPGLGSTQWKFMEFYEVKNFTCNRCRITILSDIEKDSSTLLGEDAIADECDWASFVDLLTKTLDVDSFERITPSQILQHPFITMSHFVGTFDNSRHVKTCMELMTTYDDLSSLDGNQVDLFTLETCLSDETSDSPTCSAYNISYTLSDEGYPARPSMKNQPFFCGPVISEENSPDMKRKLDGVDDSECGNRSPDLNQNKKMNIKCLGNADPCTSSDGSSPAKKRRDECHDLYITETVGQTCPQKSSRKRRRDVADLCSTSDGNSQAMKRLDTGQIETGRKPSTVKSAMLKRKRDEADKCTTSDGNSPVRKSINAGHIETAGQISPPKTPMLKRKRDDADTTSDGISPVKKNRNECLDVDLTVTGGQTSPRMSPLQKWTGDTDVCSTSDGQPPAKKRMNAGHIETGGRIRKQNSDRDAADPCTSLNGTSPSKKMRNVNLSKELTESIKELLRNTEAWSGRTQVHHINKRKRASMDISVSKQEENTPAKSRKISLDSGEV